MQPGVEAGFAARVIHTTVDKHGSLSILRVISNGCSDTGKFDSIPSHVVNLRTGDAFKIGLTAFLIQGKERVPMQSGSQVLPGNVIAVPKLPEAQTNDILTVPEAVSEEESEIIIEESTHVLTPLSRPRKEIPLMFIASVGLPDATGSKKGKGKVNSGDDKLISALDAISREDLAIKLEQSGGNLLLHCMSSDHANLVVARVKERYGIDIELGVPPVQYKETLTKAVSNVEGRHKKQSGGSGQFGVCAINMEPLEEGAGVIFESRIKG
jgi:translation elongation factor EF-G